MTLADNGPDASAFSAKSLRALCLELTRDAFERQYPHPWLALGLELEASEDGVPHTLAGPGPGEPGGSGSRAVLSLRSGGLSFLPLRKRPGSSDSMEVLTVGRSRDSDVLLVDASISKLHARFTLKEGAWWLADANSRNGTFMNFRPVPADEGLLLRDRAVLKFGSLSCTVLMRSGELYDVLVGKPRR
jgi:hypothetical protein